MILNKSAWIFSLLSGYEFGEMSGATRIKDGKRTISYLKPEQPFDYYSVLTWV